MKIATWNVNSVRARLSCLDLWIQKEQPDVILLQEIKCQKETFPQEFFENLGYVSAVYGQKAYNGVAILSRYSMEDVVMGLPNFLEDPNARYLEAVIDGNIRVISLYVPNGGLIIGAESFLYKLKFLEKLSQRLVELAHYQEKTLVGGDYNIAPDDDDVYDATVWKNRVCCTEEERQLFRRLLDAGFYDTLKCFCEKTPAHKNLKRPFTWWDYRSKTSFSRNAGLRLDHFLITSEALQGIQTIKVDAEIRTQVRPSDHAPVTCVLA